MNTHSLALRPDRIVITIPTVNPAADAARYMSAIQRTVQTAMMNEFLDADDHQDIHALLELLGHLNPLPNERELKEAFKL